MKKNATKIAAPANETPKGENVNGANLPAIVTPDKNPDSSQTIEEAEVIAEPATINPQPKTVKDIMEKNKKITHCLEKLKSIDDAEKSLDSFNLGRSGMKDNLIISDGKNKFETSKTDLIAEVIDFLKKRVETKTAEVEAELLQLEAI